MAVSDFMKPGRHMKQRVKILTVDPATRRVEGVLKDGTAIQIAVWEISPLFRWPKEEENWSVWKENGYWMLDSPMEDKRFQDKPVEDLNAGDVRVNAPGDMHITAQGEIQASGKIVANDGLRIPPGASAGLVWVSDANGNGSWSGLTANSVTTSAIASGAVTRSKLSATLIQTLRVTTGVIAAADADVAFSWTTPFADANYTLSAEVLDSTASNSALTIHHIEAITASGFTLRIVNDSGGNLTGTIHAVGFHD